MCSWRSLAVGLIVGCTSLPASAQRVMERLSRGVIAVNQGEGKVHLGWRLFGDDPESIAFNLYRSTGGAAPVKLNPEPITRTTDFVDSTVDLSKARPNSRR